MKKQRLFKNVLVLLLCVALVLPCLPINAFAAKLDNFDTGSDFSGVKLSLIGDSISTYYGVSNSSTYNPLYLSTSEATFGTYYGNTSHGDYAEFSSVKRADTWWQQTVDTLGMDLLVNNAWSGSFTLIDQGQSNTTEYPAAGYKNRAVNLHKGSTKPDIICVYLGTNDIAYYSERSVGTKANVDTASERNALYTSVNSYKTPTTVIQAYYIMISRMLATYPNAEIYCLLPTICQTTMSSGRKTALNDFNDGVRYIVDYYAGTGKNIFLVDLPQNSGLVDQDVVRNYYYCNNVHPSCEGMDFITSCVVSEILEHSKKGKQTSEICDVTYSFDGAFSKTGLPRKTVVGKPFNLDILPYYNGGDLKLTVTMKDANGNNVTIPGDGISGNSVYIPSVTGDITVKAEVTHENSFYWKANSDDFVAVPGNGYTYNKTTLLSGTYTASGDTGTMDAVQYSLNKSVVLQYDKPWVMEWKSGGNTYAGGIMLFNKTADSSTDGNMYVHITQSNVFFGYRDSVGYNNSGIAWTTIAEKLGSSAGSDIRNEMLEFKVVNVPNGTNNKLWLYVNGVQIGTMDSSKAIGGDSSHASVGSINLSGKDFEFNYLGSASHPWQNCNISYIRVHETGSLEPVTSFKDYRWEPSGGKLVSVENESFAENFVTQITGSISGTTFTDATFLLDQDVVLMHDKYWVVEWASSGNTAGHFLMTTILDYKANGGHYIFRQRESGFIGIGEWNNGIHHNYGLSLDDYGIDGSVYHVYQMKNEPIFKDGAYVSNMVYLYVDGVKIDALNQYFPSGDPDGTTSDWANGRDLVFGSIGNTNFPVTGCDIEYLQVHTDCVHTFGSWKVTTAATCLKAGVETRICSQCGEEETRVVAATGHEYTSKVTAPNCTEGGYTTYTCSCGDTYKADEVAALGHKYESAITTAPGCESAGVKTYTCKTCGDKYTEAVDPTGHKYTSKVTAPTCTEKGYTTYTCACGHSYKADEKAALGHKYETVTVDATCTVDGSITDTCATCGDIKTQVIPAKGHSYDAVVTAPTCTETGYTTYTCHCGDSYKADEVAALGHKYETVTVDATCTADGSITDTCAACGDTKTQVIPAKGHDHKATVTDPTCTEAGFTTYTCHCGDTYTADEVAALGHKYEAVITTAPGCESAGVKTFTCKTCGNQYIEPLAATGHKYAPKVTAPTCTEKGYTTYTCPCGHSYKAEEVAALGHKYETVTVDATCTEDGSITDTCSVCGDKQVETIPAKGHSHDAVVTAPTCTDKGYTTYTCHCGDSYVSDEVAALGHKYETVTVGATCTEDGSITDTCSVCGDIKTQVIPAEGHKYTSKVTAPTCTEKGYTTFTCHCGDTYKEDEVAALGHKYETVTVDATCTEDGAITDTCVACGDTKTQVIPANGHDHKAAVTDPTCTQKGYTTYTCHCGDSYIADKVAALGHSYETVVEDPTCTEDGAIIDTCVACGDIKTQVIPANGHDHKATVTAPTCTDKGYTTYTCYCGDSYVADEVAALGHKYETVTVDATCTEDGSITDTCAACGDTKTQVIPAKGHDDPKYTNNGDTHSVEYPCCGSVRNEAHSYVNGACICGAGYVVKNGIYAEDGGLFYYRDDCRYYAGLIEIDGDYYYIRSSGQVVTSRTYWVTKTNGLVSEGNYEFGADGKMIRLKNGLVAENGGLFYYVNGNLYYAGLIKIDGAYYYIRSNGQAVTSRTYWVTKTNDLMPVANYEFGADGKMIQQKSGLVAENGGLFYYVNGTANYAGLIKIDGAYYYIRSSGQAVTSRTYWVTKTNGLLPEGNYQFDADGKMILQRSDLVAENGGLFYYVNGTLNYAGLIKLDGAYYYIRSNGQAVTSRTYWVTKTNGLLPEANYSFDADGVMVNPPA